jgi:hypothetical protein
LKLKNLWVGWLFLLGTYNGIDAWVSLAVIARETNRIRIGTLLSPISRMRPWKIASEVLSLDILSKGRVTLCVGLGAIDTGFNELGKKVDGITRAELLDEGLEIMNGLWKWELMDHKGKHYTIKNLKECDFFTRYPPPRLIQTPRVPIWVVGAYKSKKSMERTLRYDGIIPTFKNNIGEFEEITPKHIQLIRTYIDNYKPLNSDFDIIVEGITTGDNNTDKSMIKSFSDAGATWWIESNWNTVDLTKILERLKLGPPRLN